MGTLPLQELARMQICSGGVACFHGSCGVETTAKTTNEVCLCDELYSGSQCSYRNGLLYFELPLAAVTVTVFAIMGLRVSSTAWSLLRFPESTTDFFEFPRTFKPIERDLGGLRRLVGTWEGPIKKRIPMRHSPFTRLLIVVVVVLEALPYIQTAAIAFLPAVPWSVNSMIAAKFLRLSLLHPLWSHEHPQDYSHSVVYLSAAAVPSLLGIACILGIKRFPLFKPQPVSSPPEDVCTIALRLFSSWVVLPLMIMLLMPLECLFVGFMLSGSLFAIPAYDPVCFTWIRVGHVALSITLIVLYNFLASAVGIQLNCESSQPTPTLWTDARSVWVVHSIPAPLAMSVIAFGNSNPPALCICVLLAGLCTLLQNLWMRPCIYSLVNGVRIFGGLLVTWSGIVGIIASVTNDPRNESPFELWTLGAVGLTAVTVSSLFVHYVEEFWFTLSLLKERQRSLFRNEVKSATVINGHTTPKASARERIPEDEALSPEAEKAMVRPLRLRLPPIHVLRKRSRRTLHRDIEK